MVKVGLDGVDVYTSGDKLRDDVSRDRGGRRGMEGDEEVERGLIDAVAMLGGLSVLARSELAMRQNREVVDGVRHRRLILHPRLRSEWHRQKHRIALRRHLWDPTIRWRDFTAYDEASRMASSSPICASWWSLTNIAATTIASRLPRSATPPQK